MTDADRALASFNNAIKTISLVKVCANAGATYIDVGNSPTTRRYLFPDGSELHVTGRGISHRVEAVTGLAAETRR